MFDLSAGDGSIENLIKFFGLLVRELILSLVAAPVCGVLADSCGGFIYSQKNKNKKMHAYDVVF